jgi:large subunit ribosomal protein L24
MPAGRTALQMTLSSQGRSASALAGALSGGGIVKIESGTIAGLDPRAFDVAIRASDAGQVADDTRLRQVVEPALSAGSLPVALAEIPFTVQDGRLHVDATTLDAQGARAKISGGYDIPADQADIRVTLTSTTQGAEGARPEIQLFTVGSPDTLHQTVDVSPLSRWLALRAIDRETRRLDSLERGGPQSQPTTVPPSTASLPEAALPEATMSQPPVLPVAPPPRRSLPKVIAPPRPPAAAAAPLPGAAVSQQVPPLPPAIEVKPAPAPLPPRQKPRSPLTLTPPTNP